jgi:hypothetical protein
MAVGAPSPRVVTSVAEDINLHTLQGNIEREREVRNEMDRRYSERFQAQERALDLAVTTREKAQEVLKELLCQKIENLVEVVKVKESERNAVLKAVGEQILRQSEVTEKEIQDKITALEKQTFQQFASSDKAITKAEAAQKEHDIKINEFRGQLDDQAKTFMSRTEVDARFKSVEEKIEILRDYRSELIGRGTGTDSAQTQSNWAKDHTVTIILVLVAAAEALVIAFKK